MSERQTISAASHILLVMSVVQTPFARVIMNLTSNYDTFLHAFSGKGRGLPLHRLFEHLNFRASSSSGPPPTPPTSLFSFSSFEGVWSEFSLRFDRTSILVL